ncbi:hypothetical protein R3W88_032380 [Solanum pinnatisectum]|uniref:F-box domain-containing protein n=1 Tax=Solanum pinnatisectum TaxID=50273 RepID=A0AAV9LP81_9SOLN|nr:hypothetical protein R3W88_032380 [Solanum pinnatisectum]
MDSVFVSNPNPSNVFTQNLPHDIIIDILTKLPVKSLISSVVMADGIVYMTARRTDNLISCTILRPLCFMKDGSMMFQKKNSSGFVAYNSITHELEQVNVIGIEANLYFNKYATCFCSLPLKLVFVLFGQNNIMDSIFVSNPKYRRNNYPTQNIPNDIIIDIRRLPVKSLIRFKNVCRSWYSLVKNDKFIKQHYDTHKSYQKFFMVSSKHMKNQFDFYHYTMDVPQLDSSSNSSLLESPIPIDELSTKEQFHDELLFPYTIEGKRHGVHRVGEKLCLSRTLGDHNHQIGEFWLYMVKTNSWNKILTIPLTQFICLRPLSLDYNSIAHELEQVNVIGIEANHYFSKVVTYVETLSSPNC